MHWRRLVVNHMAAPLQEFRNGSGLAAEIGDGLEIEPRKGLRDAFEARRLAPEIDEQLRPQWRLHEGRQRLWRWQQRLSAKGSIGIEHRHSKYDAFLRA